MRILQWVYHAGLPLLAMLIAFPGRPAAQSIDSLVDSQDYVFQAQTAQPERGPIHYIEEDIYTLKVTKGKVVSDLPYFGRAYIAPIARTTEVLQFTSKKYDYQVAHGKKEGWNVTIKPKDNSDIQQIQLNISSAGYASLQVISMNQDPISFTGIIKSPGKR